MKTKRTILILTAALMFVIWSIKINAQSTGNNTWVSGDFLGYYQTSYNLNFGFGSTPITYMALTPSGYLGIGTTSPVAYLDVNPLFSGVATNIYDIKTNFTLQNNNTGAVTNFYGAYITTPTVTTGTITNTYALVTEPNAGNVGVGTITPDASSLLDVYSANKGVLIPNVALLSATDATTIASPQLVCLYITQALIFPLPAIITMPEQVARPIGLV